MPDVSSLTRHPFAGLPMQIALMALGVTALGCQCADPSEGAILTSIMPSPSSYDPISSNKSDEVTLLALVHSNLVRWDAGEERLVAELADSYEQSEDGKAWTFHLRDTATPDGHQLNAEDVCFSFDLHVDPAFRSMSRANLLVDERPFVCTATDPRIVTFETQRPYPFLPQALSEVTILPAAAFQELAETGDLAWRRQLDQTADLSYLQGFGPFYVTSRRATRMELRRNPGYRVVGDDGVQRPVLDGLHFEFVDDPNVSQMLFRRDERLAARSVQHDEAEDLMADPRFQVLDAGPADSTLFMWMNMNPGAQGVPQEKIAVFRDPRFRHALGHAIDRQALVAQALNGQGEPLFGPISPAYKWAADSDSLAALTPSYDLDAGRRELAAMGIEDRDGDGWVEYARADGWAPLTLMIYTTPSPDDIRKNAADQLVSSFRKLGVKASYEVHEFGDVVQRIDESHDYEAALMFLEGGSHPSTMRSIFCSSGRMHFFDPAQEQPGTPWEASVDELFETYRFAADQEERERSFEALQRVWVEAQPVFYLAVSDRIVAVRTSVGVEGMATSGRVRDPLLQRPTIETLRLAER